MAKEIRNKIDQEHWDILCELKETRLRAITWKVLHNIFPTNILLSKMKIKDKPECDYCNEPDYLEHFFYKCKTVSALWREIQKELQSQLDICIKITEQMVMTGAVRRIFNNRNHFRQVNLAIAIGKVTISKFKYGKKRNIMEIYEKECWMRKLWDRI